VVFFAVLRGRVEGSAFRRSASNSARDPSHRLGRVAVVATWRSFAVGDVEAKGPLRTTTSRLVMDLPEFAKAGRRSTSALLG